MIRIFRRRRGLNRIQKLADFKTAQLDIRNIVSNSIALKDFFRCYLSRQERILLAYQRTRVLASEESELEIELPDVKAKFKKKKKAASKGKNDPLSLGK